MDLEARVGKNPMERANGKGMDNGEWVKGKEPALWLSSFSVLAAGYARKVVVIYVASFLAVCRRCSFESDHSTTEN